jgi:hypothetical protein
MGEHTSQRTLTDESHKVSDDYKSALALLGGGATEVTKAVDHSSQYDGIVSGDGQLSSSKPESTVKIQTLPDISVRTETLNQVQSSPPAIPTKPVVPSKAAPPAVPQTPAFTWVHHTDGYHYKKKVDGSFDATPHIKNNNGSYIPYS